MRIFIPTSNTHIKYIEVLKYSIDKYWSKDLDVTILGYEPPKFDIGNFKFHSMGVQRGKQFYSSDLYDFYSQIDDKFYIQLTDDNFIIKNVNKELLNIFIDNLSDTVGRVGLTADISARTCVDDGSKGYDNFRYVDNYQIINLKQNANYRTSTQISIWNREFALKYLEPNLTPWQFELEQSEKSINDGYDILGSLNEFVFYFAHLSSGGRDENNATDNNWFREAYTNEYMLEEDKAFVKKTLKI